MELVANALNFTDTGFVRITAILAKHKRRELIIKLIVEDSGIGIPKDKQQEIYVQFKRLTPSYQGIYKGVGLGLSILKQFVNELGGEIYVESEPAKGSKFTCIFPINKSLLDDDLGVDNDLELRLEKNFEKIQQQINQKNKKNISFQPSILIVEDNSIAQTVAKSILEQFNCKVDIAEYGEKAVALWKNKIYNEF